MYRPPEMSWLNQPNQDAAPNINPIEQVFQARMEQGIPAETAAEQQWRAVKADQAMRQEIPGVLAGLGAGAVDTIGMGAQYMGARADATGGNTNQSDALSAPLFGLSKTMRDWAREKGASEASMFVGELGSPL